MCGGQRFNVKFQNGSKLTNKHCLQFILGVKVVTRETENNAYAKFWGDKLSALWYVMVFSGVVSYWWTASNWDNRRAGKLKINKGMYI